MTDNRPPLLPAAPDRPRSVRRPNSRMVTIKTSIVSLIAAAAITAGLAAQMATGHDPALGAGDNADATSGNASTTAEPAPTPAPAPVVTSAS